MNLIKNILNYFFPPKHVMVPKVLIGSPEWLPPYASNPSQDWFLYFSLPYHDQIEDLGNHGKLGEDNCELQSAIACVEALMNWYIKNYPNNPRAQYLKRYYANSQGYVRLSVRYQSKMANVKQGIGTSVQQAWDSIYTHGVVPESVYGEPVKPFTFEEYMQELPPGIEQYASYSLTLFKVIWTPLVTNGWQAPNPDLIRTALKSCPIQFSASIGNIVNGVEQYLGNPVYQHARVIGSMQDTNPKVLNNYSIDGSFINILSPNFPLPCMVMAQLLIK